MRSIAHMTRIPAPTPRKPPNKAMAPSTTAAGSSRNTPNVGAMAHKIAMESAMSPHIRAYLGTEAADCSHFSISIPPRWMIFGFKAGSQQKYPFVCDGCLTIWCATGEGVLYPFHLILHTRFHIFMEDWYN